MNQRAIEQMITATRGHADARRLLASFPGLHDANGLTAAGDAFASAYVDAISRGATGREAEAKAKKAADKPVSRGQSREHVGEAETRRVGARTRRRNESSR